MKKPDIHPAAHILLDTHDQTNWMIGKDKVIYSSMGCYRILERRGEKYPAIVCAFAEKAEDLELVPHPENPNQKILKKPAYILEPVASPSTMHGSAELRMRTSEGNLLLFEQREGNLYYTGRKNPGDGEYFSNTIIEYGIFQDGDDRFNVTYRLNTNGNTTPWPLDHRHGGFLQRLAYGGIELKTLGSRDEALQFIHDDYRKRFDARRENLDMQSWSDANVVRNVAMWMENWLGQLGAEPGNIFSHLTKIAELALSKFRLTDVVIEMGERALERKADSELHGNALSSIAEVEEDGSSRFPLYRMREDARADWIAVENPQPPLLLHSLPVCDNMDAYYRARAIDIVHGIEPVLIRTYDGNKDLPPVTTARSHEGVEVHYLDNGRVRYVTYAPADPRATLPSSYAPLFSEAGVACVELRDMHAPLAKGEEIFHRLPHDPEHWLIYSFKPIDEIANHFEGKIAKAVVRHRMPVFRDSVEKVQPQDPVRSRFRKCADALLICAKVITPIAAIRKQDLIPAYTALAVGIATECESFMPPFLQDVKLFQDAKLLAFTAAAGYLTQRLGANVSTLKPKLYSNAASSALFTAGLLSYTYTSGLGLSHDVLKEGLTSLTTKENLEGLGAASSSLILGWRQLAKTIANTRIARAGIHLPAFMSHLRHAEPMPTPVAS